MTTKRASLGSRGNLVQSALSETKSPASSPEADVSTPKEKPIGIGIRMTPSQHEELRRISYETRLSLNSLLLEGVEHVIKKYQKRG